MLRQFLTSILPDEGFCAVVTINNGRVSHHWAENSAALVDLAARKYNGEVYFACSSYDVKERKQKNVLAVKALWADLDLKGTSYASFQEALAHVAQFCKHYDLPQPTIVFSGGGFHLYWPFNIAISADNWLIYANGLHNAATAFGLQLDVKRTRDSASILRVPGTINGKYTPTRSVAIVGRVQQSAANKHFGRLLELAGKVSSGARKDKPTTTAETMLREPTSDADANYIARNCPQLAHFRDTGSTTEPHWYGCANILKHCKDGESIFLEWSSKYDGYDEDKARTKFAHARDSRTGPTTCDHFKLCNKDICAGCIQPRSVNTPLNCRPLRGVSSGTGGETITSIDPDTGEETKEELPDIPQPFSLASDGRIVVPNDSKVKGAMGMVAVTSCDVRFVARINAEDGSGDALVLKYRDPKDPGTKLKEISFPSKVLYGPSARSELAAAGIYVHEWNLWQEYVKVCIDTMNQEGPVQRAYSSFGWQEDESFICGPWKYTDKGRSPAVLTPDIKPRAKRIGTVASGSFKGATRVMNRIMSQMSSGQILSYLIGLGAPLVRYTDIEEGGLASWDFSHESGTGKSTMIMLVEAAVGQPCCTRISERDTNNATAKIFSTMRNLPITVDDPTLGDGSGVRRLLDLAVAGTDKASLDQSRNLRSASGNWRTTFIAASNFNPFDYVDSQRKRRIIGFHEPRKPALDRTIWPELAAELRRNGGWIFHELLRRKYMPLEQQERARQMINSFKVQLDKKFNFRSEDRFNVWAIAIALTVGQFLYEITSEVDDPINFDIAQMIMAGVNAAKDSMDTADKNDGGSAKDVLSDFIAAHAPNMATVFPSTGKGIAPRVDVPDKGKEVVLVYYEKDGEFIVRRSKFTAWVKSIGRSPTEVLRELSVAGTLSKDNAYRDMTLPGGPAVGTQRCCIFTRKANL